jgi:hypothetical protein
VDQAQLEDMKHVRTRSSKLQESGIKSFASRDK